MKSIIKTAAILSFFAVTVIGYGQDEKSGSKLTVDVGADFVSSYIWRGLDFAGASVQPALSISAYGFTIGTWGSVDFSTIEKEVDLYLSYEIGGFSVSIADYWWSEEGASFFRNKDSHHIDVTLGYTFPEKFPLSLEVSTMLAGEEDRKECGKQNYSTYISASYPFTISNIDCELGIGVTPYKGMYSDKFDVATITAKATKNLQLSSKFTLPIFTELIFSPAQDKVYLVFGVKF